ncbi:hypothetical protein FJ960_26610 [Mesorhizobium sp. B2-3-11]|uniref:VOC family protein n=1 Tax=Mesorhizobium sp. B2-3-11 TaxID=2589953 RepID=UPI001129E696|nr:VOC family protein [Mesorhizobium sp. B2-3-11]TPL96350.1 hypothetical protein FJ960_26610 [Mesorhizobium sp. B2-3-11]
MKTLPKVLGPTELSNSFLGNLVQVCVFTRDYRRTLEGFINLGVGPWTIRTVDSSKNIEVIYRDLPADFSVKLCLANSQNMNWEIIEPLRGRSIYADFLERHGDGLQHLAFSCNSSATPSASASSKSAATGHCSTATSSAASSSIILPLRTIYAPR